MKRIKVISPAKINLTLEIIGKLPDGFHSLRSIMLKSEKLFDELKITIDGRKRGIKIFCNDKNVPTDERNSCYKIASLFLEKIGREVGINIKIRKNIPLMAGLGGGSSNAAIVLLVLNKYFKKTLSAKELVELAQTVGKDIPFFLQKERAAYVTGAGEKVRSIRNFPELNLLIINPKVEIKTVWAYQELDKKMWFMSNKKRKNISQKLLKNIRKMEGVIGPLYNDFELLMQESSPINAEMRNILVSLGAQSVTITGKGPTLVGVFESKKEAKIAKLSIKKGYPDFWVGIG